MVVHRYTSVGATLTCDIEAIRFDGWNWRECHQFVSDDLLVFQQDAEEKYQESIVITVSKVDNPRDSIVVGVGDYITDDIETGEINVYHEEAFNAMYEKYEEEF